MVTLEASQPAGLFHGIQTIRQMLPSGIDELFRASALMRPKWDEKHGSQTYGDLTIGKALDGGDVYGDLVKLILSKQEWVTKIPPFQPQVDFTRYMLVNKWSSTAPVDEKLAFNFWPLATHYETASILAGAGSAVPETKIARLKAQVRIFQGM